MANLDWSTVNRCAAYGLTQGMGSLGALGKGGQGWALVAQAQQSAEAQKKIQTLLPRLDQAYQQLQQVYQQAQQVYSQAQDLASQSYNTSVLTQLDRVSSVIQQVEDLMGGVESQYNDATNLPSRPYVPGESDPDAVSRRDQWIAALPKVEKATDAIRSASTAAARQIAQANGVLKQIQQTVQRELAEQAAAAAREAQKQALEDARFRQQQQLEQARLNQQFALEQAKAQAELQMQQAQLQQQYALMQPSGVPGLPSYSTGGVTPYTPPGVPAGFMYDAATGYYYNAATGQYYNAADGRYYVTQQAAAQYSAPQGVQYAPATVQYAQQPPSWGYQAPSQWIQPQGYQTPQGQTGQELYDPNWTNVEYQDLITGEARYLRGLSGLGAIQATSAPDLVARIKGTLSTSSASKPDLIGTTVSMKNRTNAMTGGSKGVTTEDLTSIIDAIGVAASKALPSFFPGAMPEPPPPELPPRSSGMGDALKVGALVVGGGAALYGLSKLAGGSKRGRRR